MIKIGEYNELTIVREMPQGYYLEDAGENEVLFPTKYITPDLNIGDEITAFVYCDSSDREVATSEKPKLLVNQFAYLKVMHSNEVGAFCDWGVTKELFVPHGNQAQKMEIGEFYVVHMYLDKVTDRLVGSTKLNPFLFDQMDDDFKLGDQVDLLVYKSTELGYKVIINNTHTGLVYASDISKKLKRGQQLKGYIKRPREDGKIDVSLDAVGHQHIDAHSQLILAKLKEAGGQLPFNDKSDPEAIRKTFGISKKLFKKSLGSLYKKRLILIKPDGIHEI